MKKRFFWIVAGLLIVSGLIEIAVLLRNVEPAESGAFTNKELDAHAARLGKTLPPSAPVVIAAKPISPSQPVRLAIGWLGLPDEAQNRQVSDLLVAQLGSVKNLQMVDRQSLDAVLRETQFSFSGLVRAQDAVRVGKLLRADWFLLGSTVKVGSSNGVVVRVVDGRTGVFRDAAMFYAGDDVTRLAADLGGFVRQCREAASKPPKPRTYLAVGIFQNLGVNNRQADFPAKLRSYLIQAYQGDTNVGVLEREFIDVLLQEVRLDLAGLTEEGNNPVAPMQGAFWLLTGYYQSYEANGFEVEAVLRINRMFGTTFSESVSGAPEEPLFRTIKSKIDASMMRGNSALLPLSRRSEISAQIELGNSMTLDLVGRPGVYRRSYGWRTDPAKIPRLLKDAISAYQAALAMDPGNGEAKMGLASCFQQPLINKDSEARKLVREVADSPVNDRWKGRALASLAEYASNDGNFTEAVAWYRRAADYLSATNSPETRAYGNTSEDFRQLADQIEKGSRTVDPDEKLVADTRVMNDEYKVPNRGFAMIYDDSISAYINSFGTNHLEAVRKLNSRLPELIKMTPDIAPHLLALSLANQQDTNSEVVDQFVRSFGQCSANPEKVLQGRAYFTYVRSTVYDWCMTNKMYALAENLIESLYHVELKTGSYDKFGNHVPVKPGPSPEMQLEDKLRIVKARMASERWNDAMEIIKTLPPQPFSIYLGDGRSEIVVPTNLIGKCRENLHLPEDKDPRSFTLGKPRWTFHDPTTFTCDEDSTWLAVCCRLWKSGLDSITNTEISLPKRPETRITRLCDGGSKLWIGTDGDGLIEYDKMSGHCRIFTENDGLMMNSIGELLLRGDDLWIGFGSFRGFPTPGGMGKLDLKTGKAIAFTPPTRHLPQNVSVSANFNLFDETNEPPRLAGIRIYSLQSDTLLIPGPQNGFRRYLITSNTWDTLPVPFVYHGIVGDGRRIVLNLNENPENKFEREKIPVAILENGHSTFNRVGEVTNAPVTEVSAIGLDGNDLWVSGVGFLGVIDLEKMALRKYCYTELGTAGHAQVAGGYVWVLFNRSLCRILLSEVK